jgi:hypothetical protein
MTIIKLCAGCAPKSIEQLSKYYGDAECHACGVHAPVFGYRLTAILEAVKSSEPTKSGGGRFSIAALEAGVAEMGAEGRMLRFDEEKPPAAPIERKPNY